MLYKHLFSILCGHLNLNQKEKNLNLTGYQSNRPVTIQTGRYTGLTDRYTGRNRLNVGVWIQIWIPPIPTGNRPNRTGIPVPEDGGYRSPVGYVNPGPVSPHAGRAGRMTTPPVPQTAPPRRCRPQGFIIQPVSGNRRPSVPVYQIGLTGYR